MAVSVPTGQVCRLPRTPERAQLWNDFVDAHPRGWWWHRTEWLDYMLAYREGRADCSHLITDELGRVVGLVPSLSGLVTTDEVMAPPLGRTDQHFSIKRRDQALWSTRILDLTPDESDLWRGVRKSYRNLIHQAEREHAILVGTSNAIMGIYRDLHLRAHGSVRPEATYAMQRDWARDGHGFVVAALDAAAAYFIVYKRRAYYASGPSLVPNVMHAVLWRGILGLKARGVEVLELGWQDRPGDDEKAKAIAFFKRGFGGRDVPMKEWEAA